MILLDTHTLIWWYERDSRLSNHAATAIELGQAQSRVLVSAITSWEVALLLWKGRLALHCGIHQWIAGVARLPGFRFIPVDSAIAIDAVHLPHYSPRDPADRIIIATALRYDASIVTADREMQGYPNIATIW
jgi:PIN domain nuclease of toxin-antitoxin system